MFMSCILAFGSHPVKAQSVPRERAAIAALACSKSPISSPTSVVQALAKGIRLEDLTSKRAPAIPTEVSWACLVGVLAHRADSDDRARLLLDKVQADTSEWKEFATASLLIHLGRPGEALAAIDNDRLSPHTAYERARAQFVSGNLANGWRDLQTVIAAPRSLGAVLFGYDTEGVMDSTTERQLAAADPSEFTSILVKFWTRLAARSGVSVPERLAEHYKRLQYANSMYYEIPSHHLREDLRAIIPVEHEDRWRIYVRFGEPSEIIQTSDYQAIYPTWIYPSSTSKMGDVFHFVGSNAKFFLMSDVGCGNWLWDRVQLRSDFQQMYLACSEKPPSLPRLVEIGKRISDSLFHSYRTALRTGSSYTPFTSELKYSFALYQFQSSDGRREQVAVAKVPLDTSIDSLAIALSVSDTVRDAANFVQSNLRTSTTGTSATLSITSVTDFLPKEFRVTVRVPGKPTGRTYGGSIEHHPTEGNFAMSDVVISAADGSGTWTRNGHRLSPIFAVEAGGSVNLYYEVYGVQRTDTLDTTISLTDSGGLLRSDRTTKLTFSDVAGADATLATMRKLTLPDMKGELTIQVTILNRRTGKTAATVAKLEAVSR
jgi:GWxTD domain-containing protein